MTTPASAHPGPADTVSRIPLYVPEFAADPHRAYAEMRQRFGPYVPVDLDPSGVPATLVIGYYEAVRILNDPRTFPADPRAWQQSVRADCPILPMLEWRPNALRSAGDAHTRYRAATTASLAGIDQHALGSTVEHITARQIDRFRAAGRADVITEFAWPVAFQTLNHLLGCPAETGARVARGMAQIFEGGSDAAAGNHLLAQALLELVDLRRRHPGDDSTTRLLAHPARLDDTELIHQLVTLYGAGIEPQQNLIANTVLLLLADPRFAGDVLSGSLTVRDALDHTLASDPPMANYCLSYPTRTVTVSEHVVLPARQPVIISLAACNNDPAIAGPGRAGNRSHLAFSAGPHACPARTPAYLIAQSAIDVLLDVLPDLRLVPGTRPSWRPGPFHRALAALPVEFSPSAPALTPEGARP
ncbi:cytochrome P450 [Streptomyces noboritoensis]|uniref:Cytochrome P450 n=1 Tax=Streptomyces noboritoensis TaxID=67337 RepID=A0ABV6TCI4_9ACTN